ncbi:MAG: insulinase family protein [Subdoligranulum sp.]|nr:insulinase family protein [Subdoligranulum sp.]
MEQITVSPGAQITVLPAEKFNRCRISINFIWPAAREWATAEALLPLVLERGYGDCPDMTELSKKLARLYGAALAVDGTMSGQSRVLTVTVSGIKDKFALAGEALSREYADIAFGVAFRPYLVDGVLDAEAVEIEREQLREMLESEINEKRGYCIRQARRKFYGDSPAGIERNGYLDEVDGLTARAVTDAYHRMLRLARIEVTVLGADVEAIRSCLSAALEGISRTPCALPAPIAMPAVEARLFEEPLPTVQGKLCLLFTSGAPCVPEELSALRVAVAALGGTPTSRLFQNVREKQSLCYYCGSSYLSLTGMLCVDSGVEHDKAAKTRDAILHELKEMCTGEITPKELDDTKRMLKNQLAAVGDTLQGLEGWYFAESMRGSKKTPEEVAAEIDAVTQEDVRRVLSRFTLSVCYTLTKEAGADA